MTKAEKTHLLKFFDVGAALYIYIILYMCICIYVYYICIYTIQSKVHQVFQHLAAVALSMIALQKNSTALTRRRGCPSCLFLNCGRDKLLVQCIPRKL